MADITRWDPWGDMLTLRQAMDRLFEDAWVRPLGGFMSNGGASSNLPLDLYETADEFVVTATMPGVRPEDIDITIQGEVLRIKGETKGEDEVKEANYYRRERRYGSFHREVRLPADVQSDGVEAGFENGVLKLRLPKAEEAKERKIQVTVGGGHPRLETAA